MARVLLLIAACFITSVAHSQPYAGATLGLARLDNVGPATFVFDDLRTALRAIGGYRVNQHFAVEGTWLRFDDVETREAGGRRTFSSADGYGVTAVASVRSGITRFEVRGGVLQTRSTFENVSSSQVPIGSSKTMSLQPWFGAGLAFDTESGVTWQLEWSTTRIEYGFPLNRTASARVLGFGAYWRFQ